MPIKDIKQAEGKNKGRDGIGVQSEIENKEKDNDIIKEQQKNEKQDHLQGDDSNSKLDIKSITDIIGFSSAVIALFSILSAVISRYISLGRCLYFEFDLDYYDFSLSNSSLFVYIFTVIAGVISIILSLVTNKVWTYMSKNLKKITKFILGIVFVIIYVFITVCLV